MIVTPIEILIEISLSQRIRVLVTVSSMVEEVLIGGSGEKMVKWRV